MGVSISGPSLIYGDNMSVIHNTQQPDSRLKKKSNSVFYHAISEYVAMKESLTGHVPSVDNPAENFRKLFQVEKIGSTLLVRCYMTYTSSIMLVNFHQYTSVDGHL